MKVPKHLRALHDRLLRLEYRHPPAPWKHGLTHIVGGLISVGFGRGSELLLVTSHDGRGVFDCATGERVARDRAEPYAFEDPYSLTAHGIGPLAGERIPMAGLYGGGLPVTTRDGWTAEAVYLDWLSPLALLVAPGASLFDVRDGHEPEIWWVGEGAGEFRAWGFSPTGRTLILATSADVTLFRREPE